MRHIDPADLAERALDEDAAPLTSRQAGHLLRCAACTERLASFRRVVRVGRSATAPDVPVPPPAGVWEAVAAGVTADAAGRPAGADRAPAAPAAGTWGNTLTPPLAGQARGEVRVVQDGESRRVRVTVHGLPATSGYYEVWLMDRTHRKLIPLGTLGSAGTATLTLPRGVNTDAYPLLDVSAQPDDGGTAHSGDSVVRGPLPVAVPGGDAGA